jgi:hypothetical protein
VNCMKNILPIPLRKKKIFSLFLMKIWPYDQLLKNILNEKKNNNQTP